MTMRRTIHIGPGRMDSRMDHKRGSVQHPVRSTVDNLTGMVNLDQIRGLHQLECRTEGIHPEG